MPSDVAEGYLAFETRETDPTRRESDRRRRPVADRELHDPALARHLEVQLAGLRLGHELRKLREEGTEVLCLQPTKDDIAVMGNNFMSSRRRIEVLEQAQLSTARELRRRRRHLPKLPRAAKRRRAAATPQRKAA